MRALDRAVRRHPVALPAALALSMAVAAWPLKALFPPLFHPHHPGMVFLLPVALAALYGGLRPGLLVTALAGACTWAVAVGLAPEGGVADGTRMRTGALLAAGLIMSLFGRAVHRSRETMMGALREARETQEELRQSQDRLRRLLAMEHSAEDRERRRISRELHDDLQQRLAAIAMELAAARHELGDAHPAVSQALRRAVEMNVGAVVATRRVIAGLRPRVLDESGLPQALRELAADFSQVHAVPCAVQVRGDEAAGKPLPAAEADCLYRIAQEALNNVAKHARARRVRIRLVLGPEVGASLEIEDDGVGVQPEDLEKNHSFGLLGMRERALDLGGALQVRRAGPRGTVVQASVPGGPPAPG